MFLIQMKVILIVVKTCKRVILNIPLRVNTVASKGKFFTQCWLMEKYDNK
jgi:hypothetical protein